MSLNTAHAQGGVLIYNTERILIFYDGVEMGFDMDVQLPQFKGKKKGRAYLTTHRIIFNTKSAKDTLQSFSMPFHCMRQVELEQPVFGANYIKGKVSSEPGGNWAGSGSWKMWFNNGGAIEFGRAMLQAGKLASRFAPAQAPVYKPPSAPYYQAPPPAYAPPQGPMYGFVPTQTFPTPPPYNTVYMVQEPPPYPGIDPNLQPYQPQGQPQAGYPPAAPNSYQPQAGYPPPGANGYQQYPQQGGAPPDTSASKHAEAMASGNAYYNPSNPHNVYVPPTATAPAPAYGEAPPSYDEISKKQQ